MSGTTWVYIMLGTYIVYCFYWGLNWRYIRKQKASHAEQIRVNRALATAVTLAAVVVSLTARDAIVMIGGFATAFGFLMYLLLLGVHWGWRIPSIGATLGMIAGIIACFLTYYVWRYRFLKYRTRLLPKSGLSSRSSRRVIRGLAIISQTSKRW
jgi:Na+(H+)/acetate symporter ActP